MTDKQKLEAIKDMVSQQINYTKHKLCQSDDTYKIAQYGGMFVAYVELNNFINALDKEREVK